MELISRFCRETNTLSLLSKLTLWLFFLLIYCLYVWLAIYFSWTHLPLYTKSLSLALCNFKPLLLYSVITGPSQPPFPSFPPTASMNESPENGLLYHTSSRDSCMCTFLAKELHSSVDVGLLSLVKSREVSWRKLFSSNGFSLIWLFDLFLTIPVAEHDLEFLACLPASLQAVHSFSHCFSIYNSRLLFPVAFDSAAVALGSLISLPPSHHSIFVSSRIVSPVVFSSFSWDSIPMFPLEKSANRAEWGRVIRRVKERTNPLTQSVGFCFNLPFVWVKERKEDTVD